MTAEQAVRGYSIMKFENTKQFKVHSVESGFSMLEGVVALAIFSVGVLGLAALQLNSLVSAGDSQQRTLAIWKAQELADRIRGNTNLADKYIDAIGNDGSSSFGVDSADNIVSCSGSGATFPKPTTICADTDGNNAANCDTENPKIAFDLWEVFCHPDTGLATQGESVTEGSGGLLNLEVAMQRNEVGADGNSDITIGFEWVSREADANTEIRDSANIETDLCGVADVQVDPVLEVYCLRFKP